MEPSWSEEDQQYPDIVPSHLLTKFRRSILSLQLIFQHGIIFQFDGLSRRPTVLTMRSPNQCLGSRINTDNVPMPSEPWWVSYYLLHPSSSRSIRSPSPVTESEVKVKKVETVWGRKQKLSIDQSLIMTSKRVRRKLARVLGVTVFFQSLN